jgi:RimJ/RimL family protein N-acetyltransferase
MLRGELILLRARSDNDLAVLDDELHDDVETRVWAIADPWRPVPSGPETSSFRVTDLPASVAAFSVEETVTGELAGVALLWGIDQFNRVAHLGLGLRPAFRGRGLSTDILRVLCRYGFRILGLNRLQLETAADNAPMIAAAKRAGFVTEGTLRRVAWIDGAFRDEVIFGLLAPEWTPELSSG